MCLGLIPEGPLPSGVCFRDRPNRAQLVLSSAELQKLLTLPDLGSPVGVRDQALLEAAVLESISLFETQALNLSDFATPNLVLSGRTVPLENSAVQALGRYLATGRPALATPRNQPFRAYSGAVV